MKAFPLDYQWGEEFKGNNGMDLRDYFAAKVLQALMDNFHGNLGWNADEEAQIAYVIADAMMKAREK